MKTVPNVDTMGERWGSWNVPNKCFQSNDLVFRSISLSVNSDTSLNIHAHVYSALDKRYLDGKLSGRNFHNR